MSNRIQFGNFMVDFSMGYICALGASCVLAGCGAAVEEDDMEADMGTVSFAMGAPSTPGFQMGTRNASTRQRCDKTSSGQVCLVPPSKTLSVCVMDTDFGIGLPKPIFTFAESSHIHTILNQLDGISGWTFNVDAAGLSDCDLVTRQIEVYPGSVGSSGTSSADVKDYAASGFAELADLTESASTVGQYQRWGRCAVTVDRTDINAKGANSTQDLQGIDHAAAHGLLACLGIGGRTGDGGRASRNLFDPSSPATTISSGEICTLTAFASGTPNVWNTGGSCPSE